MEKNEIARLVFACIILSPFIGAACYGIYCRLMCVYRHYHCKCVAPNQRLMFCQLSKGDVVWGVEPGEKPVCYYVEDVKYKYDGKNEITGIFIYLYGRSEYLLLTTANSKSFSYEVNNCYENCKYFTLMGEALASYNACSTKRDKEILKMKTSSPAEIKKAAENTIKNLEELKNSLK